MQPLSSENHVFKVWGGSKITIFLIMFGVRIQGSVFIVFFLIALPVPMLRQVSKIVLLGTFFYMFV